MFTIYPAIDLRGGKVVRLKEGDPARMTSYSDDPAEVDYGIRYACAVRRENVFGVQFHPEKSQAVGLRILKNFVEA